jgi:hypothetical protein
MTEADKFAVDPAVSPRRVVGRHLNHKTAHRHSGGWPSWPAVGLGPVLRDSTAMPAQQRVRGYQPARAHAAGQGLSDRAEQSPIIICDHGTGIAPAEHGDLVAQHDDLEVLGAARTNSQTSHRREETVQDSKHEASLIGTRRAWSTHTTEFRARTGSPGWRPSRLVRRHAPIFGPHRPTCCSPSRAHCGSVAPASPLLRPDRPIPRTPLLSWAPPHVRGFLHVLGRSW